MAGPGLVGRQEFKIAYNGETRHAIRQASEQLVEYDFYPFRLPPDRWLVVRQAKRISYSSRVCIASSTSLCSSDGSNVTNSSSMISAGWFTPTCKGRRS